MNKSRHFCRIRALFLSRAHLGLLVIFARGLAVPHFHAQPTAAASGPSANLRIDPHVHAMSVTPLGLQAVAKWMEERNVERCIVSPLNHKGSRPQTEEERATMLANFLPYKDRIDRMCIIDPGEVATVDLAVALLKREIADGAVAFGEHYGVGLMFDDPKNLLPNQDKLLWATDEGWWSFGDKSKQMNPHYTFLEELELPAEVRHKIYRGNAEKVYGLRKEKK